MNRIVKVIYEDGTISEPQNIKPLVILESDDQREKYIKTRQHNFQFKSFEEEILENLYQQWVEDYAENTFDLVKEIDDDEKTIDDFSDSEILQEISCRNLFGKTGQSSIISEEFISRFCKIMEKENQILLDNVLTEFENKLNI